MNKKSSIGYYTFKKISILYKKKHKYHWIITLNEYPDIYFHDNVFHDFLTMGSSRIQTDFDKVFCENALENFKRTHEFGLDYLSFLSPIYFIYGME